MSLTTALDLQRPNVDRENVLLKRAQLGGITDVGRLYPSTGRLNSESPIVNGQMSSLSVLVLRSLVCLMVSKTFASGGKAPRG